MYQLDRVVNVWVDVLGCRKAEHGPPSPVAGWRDASCDAGSIGTFAFELSSCRTAVKLPSRLATGRLLDADVLAWQYQFLPDRQDTGPESLSSQTAGQVTDRLIGLGSPWDSKDTPCCDWCGRSMAPSSGT
jgi:hypothetical protein